MSYLDKFLRYAGLFAAAYGIYVVLCALAFALYLLPLFDREDDPRPAESSEERAKDNELGSP